MTQEKEACRSNWISREFEEGLFSVIVPTYNRQGTIVETLDSVWHQTYRPIEIVIIDDGSVDDTCEVVSRWMTEHPEDEEFRYSYEFQENRGVCAARNRALRKSKGQYIQFLDSDDLIHPERCEKLANRFIETGCDYVETGFESILSDGTVLSTHLGHTRSNHLDLLLKGGLLANTLRPAYSRDLVYRNGGWNEDMVTFEDYEYVIRALTLLPSPKVESIGEILASARRDSNGRRSDIFGTREGRRLRVHCEEVLCNRVRERDDIATHLKVQLASRLYGLGLRSNGSGWPDLGEKCGRLAESLAVELDAPGRRRRMVWRLGRVGGLIYQALHDLRSIRNG